MACVAVRDERMQYALQRRWYSTPVLHSPWMSSLALAIAVGIAYFLAAHLGLALLTEPDDVAVFWPASGIAAGTLIALGPKARWPVAIGIMAATVGANLMGDRNLAASVVFALCNAGECLLIAWLIKRHSGPQFSLDSVRDVLGLLAAVAIGTAVLSVGGTLGFILFHNSETPFLITWWNWFASATIGVISVAPFVIGLIGTLHDRLAKSEIAEGLLLLAVLALVSTIGLFSPGDRWFAILPITLLAPPVLCLAARCRPVFAAAAVFTLAFVMVCTLTFGIGRLGDPSIPLATRILAVQAGLLALCACMLVVSALLTERRHHVTSLEAHKASLADALAAGRVMAFDWNAVTGRSCRSDNAASILGIEDNQKSSSTHNAFLRQIHPDDRASIKAKLRQLSPSNPSYALTFRFYGPNGEQVWLEERGKGEFDTTGRLLRVKGLTRNITDRKKAELVLEERNIQVGLAEKASLVGSFAYDIDTEIMQISQGYVAIHGFPEGITEIARSQCLAGVHADDIGWVEQVRSQSFRARRREYNVEYRITRVGGEVRWVETRCFIAYASDGHPQRVLGVSIDITERKHMEQQQHQLVAELDHRVKNALATVVAIIAQTQEGRGSLPDFVAALDSRIQSLARTHELLSRSHWAGVSLHDIVERELAPYDSGNVEIDGPHVELTAAAGQAMAMVLHELATNAAKYGALSTRSGRVELRWWWLRNGSSGRLAVEWREIDGPPVQRPSQTGYGTSIIRELVPFELSGEVDLALEPAGVTCRMEIPPQGIREGRPPVPSPVPGL